MTWRVTLDGKQAHYIHDGHEHEAACGEVVEVSRAWEVGQDVGRVPLHEGCRRAIMAEHGKDEGKGRRARGR